MRTTFLSAAVGLFACLPALANHAEKIDALVNPLIEDEAIVGCVVGVVEDGRQEIHPYGKIRHGHDEPPSGDTIYEIGSVTKAFTGTLLADMVGRDMVKLDAPLQEFLPEQVKLQPVQDRAIKLVDVASQTSGLPRMPDNFAPQDATNPYADYSSADMFAFLSKHKLQRPPDEYEYSNLGMGLLGSLLAKRAGNTYEELVIERICDPLEMNDTRITLSDAQRNRLAPPYNAELADENNWDFDALAGAGALRSTAGDLLKLVDASLADDDRPVVKAIQKAWEKQYGKPGEIGVGLGWHIARDNVTRWHNGQTGGYSAVVFVYPPKRTGVVVLCNTATNITTALGEKILQSLLGMEPAPIVLRKSIEVEPAALKKFAGTYLLAPVFWITVTVEDGRLMAQAAGQNKFQLFAEAENEFFYKVVDAQITFVESKDGDIHKLILHQNGQDLPGIKLPSLKSPTAPR